MRVQFAIASVLILSILAQTGATVSAQSTQGEIEIECDTVVKPLGLRMLDSTHLELNVWNLDCL